MLNLFALISTQPSALKNNQNAVGELNNFHIKNGLKRAKIAILAWGNQSPDLARNKAVKEMVKNPHYLKLNKSSEPAHPLFLSPDLVPISF